MKSVLDMASPPLVGSKEGSWEDWIGWAAGALANGHDTWASEVAPELTVEQLYDREILKRAPRELGGPRELRPSASVPDGPRRLQARHTGLT